MFETSVAVVGTVLNEPRTRETSGGKVVSFRVASTSRRFDKSSEQWIDGDRLIATVNCWRRVAEGVVGVVAKSSPVVVSGRLHTREYETRGQWRTAVEVEADAVGFDLARSNRFPGSIGGFDPPRTPVGDSPELDPERAVPARGG